jgi:hypothetical protein
MKIIKLLKKKKIDSTLLKKRRIISPYRLKEIRRKTQKALSKKKPYINFRTRLVLLKRNPDKKRYFGFFKKNKNNIFITITDTLGRVIISQSAGYCKIKTKKKKRSPDTVKTVADSVAKAARLKNIKYLFKFYLPSKQLKSGRSIFEAFKKFGLFTLQGVVIRNKPHSIGMRKKKPKRL